MSKSFLYIHINFYFGSILDVFSIFNCEICITLVNYSRLSNSRGGWNKRGGGAKVAKSINVEVGINM